MFWQRFTCGTSCAEVTGTCWRTERESVPSISSYFIVSRLDSYYVRYISLTKTAAVKSAFVLSHPTTTLPPKVPWKMFHTLASISATSQGDSIAPTLQCTRFSKRTPKKWTTLHHHISVMTPLLPDALQDGTANTKHPI